MPYSEDTVLEKEDEAVEMAVEAWKHELPEKIMDVSGKMILREEKFKSYDGEVEELLKDEEWNRKVVSEWFDQDQDANNFWLMFSATEATAAIMGGDGMASASGYKPFYINSRYDNAWIKMCEQFPDDVKIAIAYADSQFDGQERAMSDEEKESFSKLALHLSNDENVCPAFLWR
jgi:hypothetical protein